MLFDFIRYMTLLVSE